MSRAYIASWFWYYYHCQKESSRQLIDKIFIATRQKKKFWNGADGRIRTADLILTKWLKAPKVLLSSAFGAFLFQRSVAFGAFRSMCSISSFPRVGHGVGQAENTGRISCRMPVFSSCRFAQVTRVTSSTKWRSFFAKYYRRPNCWQTSNRNSV